MDRPTAAMTTITTSVRPGPGTGNGAGVGVSRSTVKGRRVVESRSTVSHHVDESRSTVRVAAATVVVALRWRSEGENGLTVPSRRVNVSGLAAPTRRVGVKEFGGPTPPFARRRDGAAHGLALE